MRAWGRGWGTENNNETHPAFKELPPSAWHRQTLAQDLRESLWCSPSCSELSCFSLWAFIRVINILEELTATSSVAFLLPLLSPEPEISRDKAFQTALEWTEKNELNHHMVSAELVPHSWQAIWHHPKFHTGWFFDVAVPCLGVWLADRLTYMGDVRCTGSFTTEPFERASCWGMTEGLWSERGWTQSWNSHTVDSRKRQARCRNSGKPLAYVVKREWNS